VLETAVVSGLPRSLV